MSPQFLHAIVGMHDMTKLQGGPVVYNIARTILVRIDAPNTIAIKIVFVIQIKSIMITIIMITIIIVLTIIVRAFTVIPFTVRPYTSS